MSQKCFPILYVNLAGEMLYILDQRLKVVISDVWISYFFDIIKF